MTAVQDFCPDCGMANGATERDKVGSPPRRHSLGLPDRLGNEKEAQESIVYQGRMLMINLWGIIGFAVIIILMYSLLLVLPETRRIATAGILFGCFIIGIAYLSVYATSYTVTSERVIQRKGLFSRRVSEVEVLDIRNVQVRQGIIQRLFGIGNVGISTAGQSGIEIVFAGIRDPQFVADLVREQRKRRSL